MSQLDNEKLAYSHNQIGLNVEVDSTFTTEVVYYNNVNGEKIDLVNPFFSKSYGNEISINLSTKKFN